MNIIEKLNKLLGEEDKCPEGYKLCPIKKKCIPIGTEKKQMKQDGTGPNNK